MYELSLAHLISAEHERDLEADLRLRRILKDSDPASRAVDSAPADTVVRPGSRDLRATGPVRAAGR